MLKLWNILLITLAFQFTLLGTFITRSGIISSVHAFRTNLTLVDISWVLFLVSTAGVIGDLSFIVGSDSKVRIVSNHFSPVKVPLC